MSLEPCVHSPYCGMSSFLPIKVYKLDFKGSLLLSFGLALRQADPLEHWSMVLLMICTIEEVLVLYCVNHSTQITATCLLLVWSTDA